MLFLENQFVEDKSKSSISFCIEMTSKNIIISYAIWRDDYYIGRCFLSSYVLCRGEFYNLAEGFTDTDSFNLAIYLLGVPFEEEAEDIPTCRGPYYKLGWMKVIFPRQRAASRFDCAARAYMPLLLGCTIFSDNNFTLVEAKYLPLFMNLDGYGRYR